MPADAKTSPAKVAVVDPKDVEKTDSKKPDQAKEFSLKDNFDAGKAIQSWEEAVSKGLHKMRPSDAESDAGTTDLKPPKSLFEPKLKKEDYGIAEMYYNNDDTSVGPSASIMAFLADRY